MARLTVAARIPRKMCSMMGLDPTVSKGLGRFWVSSPKRRPLPAARMTPITRECLGPPLSQGKTVGRQEELSPKIACGCFTRAGQAAVAVEVLE